MSTHPSQPLLLSANLPLPTARNRYLICPPASLRTPDYDGLTYRSTILGHAIPAALPPDSEWMNQSTKCIAFVQAAFSKQTHSKKEQDITMSEAVPAEATVSQLCPAISLDAQAYLTHLTAQLRLCGNLGARFSQYVRFYQYEREGLVWVDVDASGAIINLHALAEAQAKTHWPGQPGLQISTFKVWMTDLLCQTFQAILKILDELKSWLRSWTYDSRAEDLEKIGGEAAIEQAHMAIDYLLHYLKPYEVALTELLDKREADGARGRIEDGDGDVRARVTKSWMSM